MRQATTAEVRLDEGKAASFGACEAGNPTICWHGDWLRSNFVAVHLDETENRAQRAGNPGNVGLMDTEHSKLRVMS